MNGTVSPIQYQTVADSVYAWMKEAIIQGEFQPGERLAQDRITERLGVSRTPVRDAMKRLEAEGLIVNKPRCGAVVFDISEERLTEIYEIRILLEQHCAEKACAIITDEQIDAIEQHNLKMKGCMCNSRQFMEEDRLFHRAWCEVSGCSVTIEILETLWTRCDAFKSIYYSLDGKVRNTLNEHAKIVQGFRERDPDAVKRAIDGHLQDVVKTNIARIHAERAKKKD
ncbi:MAG: GntR family transcriptional regulator [Aristaeellaceae bacterium]